MPQARTSYLDHNATAPVRPEAAAAMAAALGTLGNPSSVHRFGRAARKLIEDSRTGVAALVGAAPDRLVFTSGGTEANNIAIMGAGRGRVLVSAIEHDSVLQANPAAERVPVGRDGVVDLEALDRMLDVESVPALVSVMLANNETGVVQPIAEVVAIARSRAALVHCDAVQACGRMQIDLAALGVDLLTLSAHKIGGPAGIGALVVGERIDPQPLTIGGGQERGLRPGTENVAGIAGFAAAARIAATAIADHGRLGALRDRFERAISGTAPDAIIFGQGAPRLDNTSCVTMPGVAAETQVMALDLAGVAVSAGAACSSGKVAPSHVLAAMGAAAAAGEAIRVSLGWTSVDADIDHAITAWRAVHARAGSAAARTAA
ncbi:MAG: cysteine desulfurase family protein [Alphaproteobacteria bacterium]|jgi:cysteine desulfurase|nr:cysteine desulfurase family protein [Alphaproteobacteria bacterium]